RVRHELIRRPLISTVQAPHCPWSQPFLVPVRWRCSRSASSSEVRRSKSRRCTWPLTVNAISVVFVSAVLVWTAVDTLIARSLSSLHVTPVTPRLTLGADREVAHRGVG